MKQVLWFTLMGAAANCYCGTAKSEPQVHRSGVSAYREAGLSIRHEMRKHCVRTGQPLRAWTGANQEGRWILVRLEGEEDTIITQSSLLTLLVSRPLPPAMQPRSGKSLRGRGSSEAYRVPQHG